MKTELIERLRPLLADRSQVSTVLSVSERTIDRMIDRGDLQTVQIGRRVLVTMASVLECAGVSK